MRDSDLRLVAHGLQLALCRRAKAEGPGSRSSEGDILPVLIPGRSQVALEAPANLNWCRRVERGMRNRRRETLDGVDFCGRVDVLARRGNRLLGGRQKRGSVSPVDVPLHVLVACKQEPLICRARGQGCNSGVGDVKSTSCTVSKQVKLVCEGLKQNLPL